MCMCVYVFVSHCCAGSCATWGLQEHCLFLGAPYFDLQILHHLESMRNQYLLVFAWVLSSHGGRISSIRSMNPPPPKSDASSAFLGFGEENPGRHVLNIRWNWLVAHQTHSHFLGGFGPLQMDSGQS